MNTKRIKNIVLVVLLMLSFSLSACTSPNLAHSPTEAYVIDCLEKVPGVIEIAAATETNDPNGQLNKAGGYTAQVYFSYSLVALDAVYGDTLIEQGTVAGGSIEVYTTKKDAESRDTYLSAFDGGVLSSGSHTVVGTCVVRTSDELTNTQQELLESNIIAALLRDDISIKIPDELNIPELDYDSLITLPTRSSDNSCLHTVEYYIGGDMYAYIWIEKYTYSYRNAANNCLKVEFEFQCYLHEMYAPSNIFRFELVAYNGDNIRIETQDVEGRGEMYETVRVRGSIVLSLEDVRNGLTIEFKNYGDW